MRRITYIFALFALLASVRMFSQTANVQVIHNSPDLAAAEVDVYLNGAILLNDFEFRTATGFVQAPASAPITIVVAPGNSTSVADGIYTLTTTLTANESYILVANGIIPGSTGYTPNQPFQLSVFAGARQTAANPAEVDVLVNHGSPDAPPVDVVETSIPVGVAFNNIAYPSFAGYEPFQELDYVIDVTTADGSTVVESYQVPLETLGLAGEAITVLASGFLDPSVNSNGPAFGIWVATSAGGDLIPLPVVPPTARVQVIHNAADLAAAEVDVYLNGTLLLDDFEFRTATPFIDAPAGEELSIVVAPGNSTSVDDGIYTLEATLAEDETYILVANGIVSPTGYEPAQDFEIYVYAMGREEANIETNTDVLVFHGATDAPTVDVVAAGAGIIVDDISYNDFQGYLELATADYTLSVTTADGATTVASYLAQLETLGLEGAAITVLASGFLDPSENSDGPAFGLWVALPAGGDLVQLPTTTLSTANFNADAIAIYPNPASTVLNVNVPFGYTELTSELYDMSGRKVAASNSDAINVSSLQDGIYILNTNADGKVSQQKIAVKH